MAAPLRPPNLSPRDSLEIVASPGALSTSAAGRFVGAAARAIRSHGAFVVALSGGDTPRGLYVALTTRPYVDAVDWSRVHVVWGDERCVPPNDAASNYRMARETLLDRVPIPDVNIHRIRGEDDPAVAAAAYERELRTLLGTPDGPPRIDAASARIDLILLGLGADGHTASIFPGSASGSEHARWVVAEHVPSVSMWRVTLTPMLLNAAVEVLFLVSGAQKAETIRRVLVEPPRPNELPAQLIAPTPGLACWLIDSAAAARLTG